MSNKRNSKTQEQKIKVIIVGSASVGKTCLMIRYIQNTFLETTKSTLGAEHYEINIEMNGKPCRVDLWDTAGEERYRAVTSLFFKGSDAAIITFDLTSKKTFEQVENWINQVRSKTPEGVVIVLVGNKADRKDRIVTSDEAKTLAKRLQIEYFQTSAVTGQKVAQVFKKVFDQIAKSKNQMIEQKSKVKKNNRVSLAAESQGTQQDNLTKKRCCS